MKSLNINLKFTHLYIVVIAIFVLISCGGNPNESAQSTDDNSGNTGEIAFQILFDRPESAQRTLRSSDICDDVALVKAFVYDENDVVLVAGENWPCEARSGILTDVPKGDRRRVVVNGLDEDGQTLLYWGISDFFPVLANTQNSAGKVIAHHVTEIDQDGDGFTPNQGDCNDIDKTINPDAQDLCNDEIDQDCNAATCSNRIWYSDQDGDGFGDLSQTIERVQCPDNYVADSSDCDDGNKLINPAADELCNGIDDNCDGVKDEKCLWEKTFDSGGEDTAKAIIQTKDGGYVIVGNTYATDDGGEDGAWLIKTDEIGELQWDIRFNNAGGDDISKINDVILSDDGGIVLAGESGSSTKVCIAKYDENGNEIWKNTTLGKNDTINHVTAMQQTKDKGYIITGQTIEDGGVVSDVLLIKTKQNGDEDWNKAFKKGLSAANGKSVFQSDSGGYTVLGTAIADESGYKTFLIETDENGDENSTLTLEYENISNCRAHSMTPTANGIDYFIVGTTQPAYLKYERLWITRSDRKFESERQSGWFWSLVYPFESIGIPEAIAHTSDGGYVIAGGLQDVGALFFKIDYKGDGEWQQSKFYKGWFYDVILTNDEAYILAGENNGDFWLFKTNADAKGTEPYSR